MTIGASFDRKAAIRFILCFGLVSLFADMTYEGAHSLIGPFLVHLNASAFAIGIISGLGEMVAASLRLFSGRLADRTRAYWTIAIAGYALNVLTIPALAFVGTWQAAMWLIVVERTGKALRGPARDVLLSEATGKVGHGRGFGLHAAMDQTGACLGPLLGAYVVFRDRAYAPAFLWLGIPAVLALASIIVARAVRPVDGKPPAPKAPQPLPRLFTTYVVAAGLLAFGFLDFPMLGQHFEKHGLFSPPMIPVLYSIGMAVVGATAFWFGHLFDKYGIVTLVIGILITMLALPFGFLGGAIGGAVGVMLWAAGLGVQDATLRAGISQVVSMNRRGTAFGVFNGVFGVAWFCGSATMGALYDHVSVVSLVAVGLAAQTAAAVMFYRLRQPLVAAAAAAEN